MSEIIDINIFPTSEEVALTIEPNLITITVNEFTGGGAVTSVNGLTGDVIIGVSDNNFTDALETKLNGIEAGAEVNVNADWNATSGDAQILNKPSLSGYVPYTGATQDVNLGEFGLQTGNIEFDLTPTNAPTNVGSLVWNDLAGTLDLKLKGGAVTLQIGQETLARVVNKTATNITLLESNYQAVRVTGAQGQRPKVDLAQANNDLNSTTTLGLVTENILNNQEGFITTSGQVQQINTTGSLQGETWADGDILYLSGTVAGRITNIKPIAPIHTVIIGFVEYAHAVNGKIFVKVDNGYELDELHNVSAVAPNNNEVLTYDTETTLWKPKTVLTALGYTPVRFLAKDSVQKTVTGTILGTIISSYLIPANTLSLTDYLRIEDIMITHTGTGSWSWVILVNTINSLTGAVRIMQSGAFASTVLFTHGRRNFVARGGNLIGFSNNVSALTDYLSQTSYTSNNPFNTTVDNYIIVSVTNTVAGDTVNQEGILITN